jgi:tetratricopeptide (TPR) repeat protein
MKDYEEAITDYTLAIALKPNDSDTYFVRGDTKQNLGQTDNACLD